MRPHYAALAVASVAALASSPWVVPKAIQSVALLTQPDDVVAIAEYQLGMVPSQEFQNAIDQALANGDPELAASLFEVAVGVNAPLPADLVQRVTDAQGFDAGRLAGDVWNGLIKGDTSSGAGLAGSLAADLTGAGDARDLVLEGHNYLTNGTYDPVVLALSAIGLTLTAATYVTVGAAAPARASVTVLKAAKKAGQLPAPLVRELSEVAAKTINGPALDQAITAAKRFDIASASAAAGRILNPAAAKKVTQLADDVAGIASKSGYRSVNQTLRVATSTADVSKLHRLAAATGTKFRGTVQVLAGLGGVGGLILSAANFFMVLSGWAISGIVWLLTAGFAVLGLGYRAISWILRRQSQNGSTPVSPA